MADTPENLTDPPPHDAALANIEQLASHLPMLDAYYAGHDAPDLLLPRQVLLFHRFQKLSRHGSYHHRHVLLLNLGEPGTVVLDGELFTLPPGSAILVFPYQHHHYADPPGSRPNRLFITFELSDDTPLGPLRGRPMPFDTDTLRCVATLCRTYQSPESTRTPTRHQIVLHAALLLQRLTALAFSSDPLPDPPLAAGQREHRPLMQAIGRYLRRHQAEPISIDKLADAVALSPSHLRHRFKRHLGISLGHYIRRSKLLRAAALIDTTDQSLGQIADQCGFGDLTAFSRSFTREMGLSPKAYRQRAGSSPTSETV